MRTLLIVLCAVTLPIPRCGGAWEPYNKDHGPFEESEWPKVFPVHPCEVLDTETPPGEKRPRVMVFGKKQKPTMPRLRLTLASGARGTIARVLNARGEVIFGPQEISNQHARDDGVFGGDLNGDGKEDFIVRVWQGGCGTIYTFSCHVAFVLSENGGYKATTVQTLWSGLEYLVALTGNGRCQFIQTSFVQGWPERCRDGKVHNFWVYNLLEIIGSRIVLTEKLDRRFPKWIWYTYKPNHKDTTLLTAEQKRRLWKRYADAFFWTPKKTTPGADDGGSSAAKE